MRRIALYLLCFSYVPEWTAWQQNTGELLPDFDLLISHKKLENGKVSGGTGNLFLCLNRIRGNAYISSLAELWLTAMSGSMDVHLLGHPPFRIPLFIV